MMRKGQPILLSLALVALEALPAMAQVSKDTLESISMPSRVDTRICTVELENGRAVKGFLCEDYATHRAKDISAFGGWRTWLAVREAPGTKVREEP